MKYSTAKEINALVKELVKDGWTYWRGGRHGRLKAPSGQPTLTISCTPSDRCAFQNFRRDLRNALSRQKTAAVNRTNHEPARGTG
jgi:predicted RNA binding protein YcfA (HicA-like mRNA interferase family)